MTLAILEIVLMIGEAIYYVVEIIQVIIESPIWSEFKAWYRDQQKK